jgi:hypothetical protein
MPGVTLGVTSARLRPVSGPLGRGRILRFALRLRLGRSGHFNVRDGLTHDPRVKLCGAYALKQSVVSLDLTDILNQRDRDYCTAAR